MMTNSTHSMNPVAHAAASARHTSPLFEGARRAAGKSLSPDEPTVRGLAPQSQNRLEGEPIGGRLRTQILDNQI